MHATWKTTSPSTWPAGSARALSVVTLSVAAVFGAAGCSNDGLSLRNAGYLANDAYTQNTSASACAAAQPGCRWVEVDRDAPTTKCGTDTAPNAPDEAGEEKPLGKSCLEVAPSPSGVCVANDPCLALGATACRDKGECAWSATKVLCPIGASCDDGGYCHAREQGGTDCACVSPVTCPMGEDCPEVECDCSSGGSGGSGGACTCACPSCGPGEDCPPCACNCDDGGPGCTKPGTCYTSCPSCLPDTDCPCVTVCEDGGNTSSGSGGGTSASGAPSDGGFSETPGEAPPCACACEPCKAGSSCPPCACDCDGGGGMAGCVGPPLPAPVPQPDPTCTAIGCFLYCADGYVKDANGCNTCVCLPSASCAGAALDAEGDCAGPYGPLPTSCCGG